MKKTIPVISTIAGAAMVGIHLFNRLNAAAFKNNSSKDENFYSWTYAAIHYTKAGHNGSPILLLHDCTIGSNLHEWDQLVSILSENHTVYAIDLPGYGKSDKEKITYTNFFFVQAVIDFIKHEIQKKTTIIASNEASMIALMSTLHSADAVEQLILINPCDLHEYAKGPNARTRLLKNLIEAPIIGTFFYNIMNNSARILDEKIESFEDPTVPSSVFMQSVLEGSHTPDDRAKFAYSSRLGRFMNVDVTKALKTLNHSISIISTDSHSEVAELYLKYNKSIEMFHVKHAKDYPHIENAVDIANIIDDLIAF